MARNANGDVRVDYLDDSNAQKTRTFELRSGNVLVTLFDGVGGILDRKLVKSGGSEWLALEFIKEIGLQAEYAGTYEQIELKRMCPKCGGRLSSSDEKIVPIVPTYVCTSCNTKSYHLTNEYLEVLIRDNRQLFTAQELSELDSSPEQFRSELKEYILKIFASKRVISIR